MRMHLVSVGNRMPAWANDSFNEFNKRLPEEFALRLIEISPSTRTKSGSREVITRLEAEAILDAIPKGSTRIILDEKGQSFSSKDLAKKTEGWLTRGNDLCFVIGGANGLSDTVKQSADLLWSLSELTLPHVLVRVMLVEQLYRAWSILNNHPYHRE